MRKVLLLLCFVMTGWMASAQTFSARGSSHLRCVGLNVSGTMLRDHTLSGRMLDVPLHMVDCNDRHLSPMLGLEYSTIRGGSGWQRGLMFNGGFGTQDFSGTLSDGTTLYPVQHSFPRLSLGMGFGFGYGFFDAIYLLASIHVGVDVLFDQQREVEGLLDNYQLALSAQYLVTEHVFLKVAASTGQFRVLISGDQLRLSDSPYATANIGHTSRVQFTVGGGLYF